MQLAAGRGNVVRKAKIRPSRSCCSKILFLFSETNPTEHFFGQKCGHRSSHSRPKNTNNTSLDNCDKMIFSSSTSLFAER